MVKPRRPSKPNATGRNTTSRFARLDHRLLNSKAYRALSPNARSLLVELTMLDKGDNNGSLYLSVRDGAHRMGVADLTAASRAFDELAELGFIEMTQEAHFKVKAADKSRARCWRLTWLAGPGRKGPTCDYLDREPESKTLARKRMERGLKALKAYRKAKDQGRLPVLVSDTLSPFRPDMPVASVADSDTPNQRKGGFQPNAHVWDFATHIAVTTGSGTGSNLISWWQPDWSPILAGQAFAASLASGRFPHNIIGRAAA